MSFIGNNSILLFQFLIWSKSVTVTMIYVSSTCYTVTLCMSGQYISGIKTQTLHDDQRGMQSLATEHIIWAKTEYTSILCKQCKQGQMFTDYKWDEVRIIYLVFRNTTRFRNNSRHNIKNCPEKIWYRQHSKKKHRKSQRQAAFSNRQQTVNTSTL